MARECEGPDRVGRIGCPLQCRLRYGSVADELAGDQVDWAGLPINLDLAFSQAQRDKVYAQHLMRRRGTQLGRRGAPACGCEIAIEYDDAKELQST